ncbi:hypothetical protein F4X73_16785 [Candidatus Poribacteria bacterium]|nr:hypothetical protein [Candidatus Poribacteria bacterium]
MTITYDFIAYSGRLSENSWTLGMRAIQGEVPLDVVLPNLHTATNAEDEDIIGVLTKEGISRESSDVMELYRYLRQLSTKTNQAFGYNEVVIRNIHTRLNSLKVDQELRVQITYTERKENYLPSTYNIKLLGTHEISPIDTQEFETEIDPEDETNEIVDIDTPKETDTNTPEQNGEKTIPKDFPPIESEISVYKSTNTLEKLIAFSRSLQSELKETKQKLDAMTERIQSLEEQRTHYRELENLLQDIVDRLNFMENYEKRIEILENDRYTLKTIQEVLTNYLKTTHRQSHLLLKEIDDESDDDQEL